jgi:hypothetical protein
MSVDAIIKIFSKTLQVPAVSLPRHNSSAQLRDELPGDLLSAPLVWVCRGGVIPPLQLSCAADPAPSPSESGPGTRSLPSATSRIAWPRTPRLAARVDAADRRVRTQAVLPQPSGSHFQTRWFLHLPLQRCHETVSEPFSYPARRFLHAWDRRRHHRCHRRGPVPSTGTATEVGPLTSSPAGRGQSLGGALWTPAYTPGDGQTSWVYSTNSVLHLYISCYVTVNKPVLSYLLLCLLLQSQKKILPTLSI